ncbi:MAG: T9SS type A sorting domain-containing protein [Bacteroidales bacterium]
MIKIKQLFLLFLFIVPFIGISQDTLNYPVDIKFHEATQWYFVSNWADGNGFILKLDAEGEVVNTFHDGLDYVGGMCLIGDVLYVVNNKDLYGGSLPSSLIGLNIYNGAEISSVEISTGGTYLDLIATDNNGFIYICDSEKLKIYKYNLQTNSVSTLASNINKPLGICYNHIDDKVMFTKSTASISYIMSVNTNGTQLKTEGYILGWLEGLTMANDGNYYLSSWKTAGPNWGNEPVFMFNHSFSYLKEISNDHNRPFGMCFGKDSLLSVCNWGDNTISIINPDTISLEMNKPYDIALDLNNYEYFFTNSYMTSDSPNGNIVRMKNPGDSLRIFYDNLMHPTGLTIHKSVVYVLDNAGTENAGSVSNLLAIDAVTGELISEIQIESSGSFLEFITHDQNDNLYITDRLKGKVYKYSIATSTVSDFIANIENPSGITYNSENGDLLFISYSEGNTISYIIKSDMNGVITDTLASMNTELKDIEPVDTSYYLVSDGSNNLIYKFYGDFSGYGENELLYNAPNGICYNALSKFIGITYLTDNLEFINIEVTGIKTPIYEYKQFEIYPNPNNGRFTINTNPIDAKQFVMNIYNINGQLVYTDQIFKNENSTNLDINELQDGMYIVRIFTETQVLNSKLTIKK